MAPGGEGGVQLLGLGLGLEAKVCAGPGSGARWRLAPDPQAWSALHAHLSLCGPAGGAVRLPHPLWPQVPPDPALLGPGTPAGQGRFDGQWEGRPSPPASKLPHSWGPSCRAAASTQGRPWGGTGTASCAAWGDTDLQPGWESVPRPPAAPNLPAGPVRLGCPAHPCPPGWRVPRSGRPPVPAAPSAPGQAAQSATQTLLPGTGSRGFSGERRLGPPGNGGGRAAPPGPAPHLSCL